MAQSKPIAQAIDITEFKQAKKALLREKHFFATVMNSSPGLLFIFDDKGNIIQWNRNAEKVTGYSAKEIAKMNILDFVANEDQKTAAEAMQEVLTKGQSSLEIKILSKPGKKTPFYITGLRTKFENTTRVVCTGIDMTEIKDIRQSLVEAQRVARVGSWEWNAVEDVITGSEEFYRLFDVTPEEIARFGQFVERLHPDDRDRVQRDVDDALRQERPYDTDYRVKLRGDGWRDINARGSTFTDADGKPVRLVGTTQDITERKRAEEALKRIEWMLSKDRKSVV
jgi:PAS domain S-box-containing protein